MASPSEFLTFYRRLATSQSLRLRQPISRLATVSRPFSISSARNAGTGGGNIVTDKGTQQDTSTTSGENVGGSREHSVDKGNKKDPNVQSYETKAAREYVTTPFLGLRTGAEAFETGEGEHVVWERTYADSLPWRSSKAQGKGGQAVQQNDERGTTARTKKEFPEAPDVVIGMQDERGQKGDAK